MSDEARKLLKRESKKAHRWDASGSCRGQWDSCPDKWCTEVRAYLAQPEPAAREVVLVEAIKHSVGDYDEHIDCETGYCLACALAATSPAAAALLAQGEALKALITDAETFLDVADDRYERMRCRENLMSAIRVARATLTPGDKEAD